MGIPLKHVLHQGPVLAGLGRTILAGLEQKIFGTSDDVEVPGPVIEDVFSPRDPELVRDYVNHVGGNPRDYTDTLPPHMFPQWGFALAPRTLKGLPYPITSAMNGGCRLEVNEPIPNDEELHVSAQLVNVDDNGSRAVLEQEVVTSTTSVEAGIVGNLYVVIPLGGSSNDDDSSTEPDDPQQRDNVPDGAREVDRWDVPDDAGLDFAKLTGDFNPLHWISPYAKMAGFPNVILHGFSTMARTYESLNLEAFEGSRDIDVLDVKFTKPLVLPAEVGVYLDDDNGVYVGDAPSGPNYMAGSYQTS